MTDDASDATIVVERARGGGHGLLRAYKVWVDGEHVGKLKRGEALHTQVAPGHHSVRVSCDWVGSPEWGVDLAEGETGMFICKPLGGPLLALHQMRRGSATNIDLRPADAE